MKKKICNALNSSKNIFLKVVKLINKNKKKVVIGLSVFLVVFISVCSFINLRYPTKINAYISHVINKGEPANSYFDDENFYKAVVDAYNKENNTSLPYTTNLTDEQLKSIKNILYRSDSEKIRSTKGIEKLINLESLELGLKSYEIKQGGSNLIEKIDLSNNLKLRGLNLKCGNLSSIDLSKNEALTYLNLGWNNISNIDLSKNTSLTKLFLSNNKISGIDLSNNTSLTSLDLGMNNISSIDLSNNTLLTYLDLDVNEIRHIDLSKNTSLTKLNLGMNNISSIDLSKNTSLTSLYLYKNNISSIDLSKNTSLTKLNLGMNNISSIDLSNNTALTSLYLHSNKLSNIDLSNNTSLTKLFLSNNKISGIDLSKNTSLTSLDLDVNEIRHIDLSNNTALTSLYLYKNNISSIDLSKNTALTKLSLGMNNISSIDLSKNTALEELDLSDNNLNSIKLYDNFDISGTVKTIGKQNTYQTSIDLGSNRIINLTKGYKYYYSSKIVIPSEADIQTFIDNLDLKNLTTKVFNNDEEVSSGKVKEGYILKLYYEDVEIDNVPVEISFDDEVFYKAVVDAYNKENNTSLSYTTNLTDEQLSSIKNISCSGYKKLDSEKIKSTKGIEKLTSLTALNLVYNKVSSIDLSKNTALTDLDLSDNEIRNIDLSKNTSLTTLRLHGNKLSSIDLIKNTVLTYLDLSGNNISSIDLSKHTSLTYLELNGNEIRNIDLSKHTMLTHLKLDHTKISNIDLSENIALKELTLTCNNISSIDLNKNTALEKLDLSSNNLSNIDLNKNTKLTTLDLEDNPLKLNAYVKENGTLTSSSIKMPEGSDKFYLTYEIEDNSIANFADNRLNGLKAGKTNATVTLNGVKASSSSTENMKVDGTITVFDRLKGDINNDDKITIADVSLLYRHVRKTKVIEDSKTLEVSELTGDDKITIADVAKLYRYVRGKINEL